MLGPQETKAVAATRFADVRFLESTDSTNRVLLELAREGAPEGVVVVADHQTAGRGRLGRVWQAPSGSSLLVSALLRPPLAPDQVRLCNVAAALAAVDACADVAGFRPSLKWPNDLVVERPEVGTRKLAGLLAESVVEGGRLRALVVGMGLNVTWPPQLPADLAQVAVAVNHVVGHEVDRGALLARWLVRLDRRYSALCGPGGAEVLLADERRQSATLGRRVRVEVPGGTFEGTAVDLTPAGHLLVDDDGDLHEVSAGDVIHLRPA